MLCGCGPMLIFLVLAFLMLYLLKPTRYLAVDQLIFRCSGEKLKAHLPKNYTKQKIQQHRQAWETLKQHNFSAEFPIIFNSHQLTSEWE